MRVPEDYIMGTGKKSKNSGCGGSFWFFVISVSLVAIGIFTGTWPIMVAIAAVLFVIGLVFFIIYLVSDGKKQKQFSDIPITQLTPIQYEEYIAQVMRDNGFREVRTTRTTGDYGADILMTSDAGEKICIQCKHYSKPVGVKAVQEVIAAKEYYRCDSAMVCASNTFTPAAQEMAEKTGVELLTIDRIIKNDSV